jgi:hypothetical protein
MRRLRYRKLEVVIKAYNHSAIAAGCDARQLGGETADQRSAVHIPQSEIHYDEVRRSAAALLIPMRRPLR